MKAADWDDRYRSSDRLWSTGPNVFVADRLSHVRPGVGLDLASGEGRNAVWLAERGWSMTAVDFSSVAVERGRQQSDQVDFVVANVLTWETEQTFDLILVSYLQLLESEFRTVISKAVDWLAPGGEMFLIGHDKSNLEHGYGGPQVSEILWEVDVLVRWLDRLDLVEAQVVRRPVEVDGEVLIARDSLVRARAAQGQKERV